MTFQQNPPISMACNETNKRRNIRRKWICV